MFHRPIVVCWTLFEDVKPILVLSVVLKFTDLCVKVKMIRTIYFTSKASVSACVFMLCSVTKSTDASATYVLLRVTFTRVSPRMRVNIALFFGLQVCRGSLSLVALDMHTAHDCPMHCLHSHVATI